MSGILFRAKSNSFRCELDVENQTGEQYSKQCKINAQKDLSTASLLPYMLRLVIQFMKTLKERYFNNTGFLKLLKCFSLAFVKR